MDSHEHGWEDLTGLTLESTQRSPTTGSVGTHIRPTPAIAPDGTKARIASLEITTTGDFNREETGIGNGATDSTSWDWGFTQLKRYLSVAKGAATYQVVDFVKKHLGGTKLIFITGETGSGKTSLLEELTGEKSDIGHTLKAGTQKYGIWPAIIDGNKYLFVDTPGFGAADMNDMSILDNIVGCLLALGPFVTVAGVLFLHSSTKDRMEASELKTIRWLQCFCGPQFYENITIITTKWDKMHPDEIDEAHKRVEELAADQVAPILDPPPRFKGAYIYNHGIPGGGKSDQDWETQLSRRKKMPERSAEIKRLVHDRYDQCPRIKLQIAEEIESKTPLAETEAAKALRADTLQTKIRLGKDRAIVLGVDEPDPEGERVPSETTTEGCQPGPHVFETPESIFEWIRIAKAVAIAFMTVQSAPTMLLHEVQKTAWKAWDSVKNWWSGPPPAC